MQTLQSGSKGDAILMIQGVDIDIGLDDKVFKEWNVFVWYVDRGSDII